MNKQQKNLTELTQWQDLMAHLNVINQTHMRDWFSQDLKRFDHFSIKKEGILLDYSRNRINHETMNKLCNLAKAIDLDKKIAALFEGQAINTTEKRPALHTALRDLSGQPIYVKGKNITEQILALRIKMANIVNQIENKTWCGSTGKPIEHIINIGIGGSYLGPMMCNTALKEYACSRLRFHFISTVDKANLQEVLQQIDPETSLFIISSKSFTTIETLTNTKTIVSWLKDQLNTDVFGKHFIAITEAQDKARAFGIPEAHILPLWEWVGGRYSVWSAIGLPLMLMLGKEQFNQFLQGAYQMDRHFRESPFTENMPVVLALLTIWYLNFFNANVQAIVPYSHRLRYLVPYLQQAEMESNGKTIRLDGQTAQYATSAVIFGAEGCNGQHAYHQLLLQGPHIIPVDFILIAHSNQQDRHQDVLIASGISQAQALMRGKTYDEALNELIYAGYPKEEATELAHHRVIPGNRPSNILFLEKLSPASLGALIALYEHKIFVEGCIWHINSFDQWGVELGKQLLPAILQSFDKPIISDSDAATLGNIDYYKHIIGRS